MNVHPCLPVLLASLSLVACDDDCPGPATVTMSGTETWCETPQGVRSGAYTVIDQGVLRIQGNYAAGEEDGEWAWFWPDGSLHERGTVREGQRVGDWERQAEDGSPLPLTRYGQATTETESTVLTHAHPEPAVFTATWLGAPVWTPARVAGLIIAPQATGLAAVDPATGEVVWQIDSPSRLAERPLQQGTRTVVALTERGGVLVARVTPEPPPFQIYELGAAASPEPVANDFGVVYVDEAGTLHDHAFEDALRPVPDLSPTVMAVAGDRLLVGTADGVVAQWDRVAGVLKWSVTLDAPITQIEAPTWESVMVESGDTWFGLDFTTGVQQWEQGRVPPTETSPIRARLDHPSAPLVVQDGAWVGTRAGLLIHLLELPLGAPEQGPWSGRVLSTLSVGGQQTPSGAFESWQVPSAGVTRTALALGDNRGAQTTLHTEWFDLPQHGGSRQLTWPDGWTHTTERAWHMRIDDVDIWTHQTPPPVRPRSGDWAIDGWVAHGDDWLKHDAIAVSMGPDSASIRAGEWARTTDETEPTAWRATTQTTATWTGVPVVPWIEAWTASPTGWAGWQHTAGYVATPEPEPPILETTLP